MNTDLSDEERTGFLRQNYDNYIPGYTGHCPTLKFHYGKCYGARTREILKDIKNKKLFKDPAITAPYREADYKQPVLKPIENTKGQFEDYAVRYKYKAPKYILGYTGFVPTLNFRYGQSYGKTADDSIKDYKNAQRRIHIGREEVDRMFRNKTSGRVDPIRSQDDVQKSLEDYIEKQRFKDHKISPEYPPIAGYTGHIPRVKGNEESLSHRYNTVVKRGLSILKQEREQFDELKRAQNRVGTVLEEFENLHRR